MARLSDMTEAQIKEHRFSLWYFDKEAKRAYKIPMGLTYKICRKYFYSWFYVFCVKKKLSETFTTRKEAEKEMLD